MVCCVSVVLNVQSALVFILKEVCDGKLISKVSPSFGNVIIFFYSISTMYVYCVYVAASICTDCTFTECIVHMYVKNMIDIHQQ